MDRRGEPGARRWPLDGVGLAYLLAVVLALVQAATADDPAGILTAAVPYLAALATVLMVRAAGPHDDVSCSRWFAGLVVGSVLLAAWLVVALVGALPGAVGEPHGFYRAKVAVTSPLGDHNTAAGLLLPGIVAAAALAGGDRRWHVGLALTGAGLVATLSRGAALVLLAVAGLAWLVPGARGLRRRLLATALSVVVAVLGLAWLLDASPPPGATVGDGPVGASVLGRVDLAVRGLEVGLEHPALGVGLGRYEEVAGDLPPPNDHAHQALTHALAEGGVGLLAVAVVVPGLLAVRVVRLPVGTSRAVLALAGVALVGHAQVEILGGRLGYEVLLALLAGLATAHSRHDSAGTHGDSA